MEIEYSIEDFNFFIKNIKYYESRISYDTNSIKIEYYSENNKRIYFFHIDPPWRIILDDKLIASSWKYPQSKNYNNDDMEKNERKWFSKTDFIKYEKIKNVHIYM